MPPLPQCPASQDLRRLLADVIDGSDLTRLEDHLSTCGACAAKLHALQQRDPLSNVLRGSAHLAEEFPTEAALECLLDRVLPERTTASEQTVDCSFLAPPEAPEELGRLGSYRITGVLGVGGMGIVLRAEDLRLLRPVALKVLRPELARNAAARQRFLREARAAAALESERVVAIFDVGEERGHPYLAMPVLRGETLADRLEREPRLLVPEVLRIGRDIAEALALAHGNGLVHRDIKPGNIWLEAPDGRGKLLDFGLARAPEGDLTATDPRMVVGTPAFMAPEQADGQQVDYRSDLFSLGCVLYRMATGALPFQGKTTMAILNALATQKPLPPRTVNPTVPPDLERLILSLLARDPSARPESARTVIETLDRLKRSDRPVRPRRTAAIALLAASLVLSVLLIALVILRLKHKDGTETVIPLKPGDEIRIDEGEKTRAIVVPSAADRLRRDLLDPGVLAWLGGGDAARAPAPLVGFFGEPRYRLPGDVGEPGYSRNGQRLAVPCGSRVLLFDTRTGLPWREVGPFGTTLRQAALDGEGRRLAVVTKDEAPLVWDVVAQKALNTPLPAGLRVKQMAFSPDDRFLAVLGSPGEIHLWDLAGVNVTTLKDPDTPSIATFAFRPDGRFLVTAGRSPLNVDQILFWEIPSGKSLFRRQQPFHAQILSLNFNAAGTRLAVGSLPEVVLWDVSRLPEEGMTPLAHWKTFGEFTAFTADHKTLLTASRQEARDPTHTLRRWRLDKLPQGEVEEPSAEATLRFPGLQGPPHYVLSPDGRQLFTVGSRDGIGRVQDPELPRSVQAHQGHTGRVAALCFSHDGQTLLSAAQDRGLRRWDLASGRTVSTLPGGPGGARTLALTPDSKTLFAASEEKTIQV